MQQRADAHERHAGKIGERFLEQSDIAGEQRAQYEAGGELAAFAQVPDQRADLAVGRDGGERNGRLLAGLLGNTLGPALVKPCARRDEARKRLGEFRNQLMACRRRHVIADQHGLADGWQMAKARDDAVEREWRNLGLWVFDQHKAGFGDSDFGDRSRHRARKTGPVGDRGLDGRPSGRDRVDQIGVEKQRRVLQHPACDLGLVGGKAQNDRRRRALAEGKRAGKLSAHQRGRIIEQHNERPLGRSAVVGGEIGIEEGARQLAGRIGALTGRRVPYPLQELTNDHGFGRRHVDRESHCATSTPRADEE